MKTNHRKVKIPVEKSIIIKIKMEIYIIKQSMERISSRLMKI